MYLLYLLQNCIGIFKICVA